MKKMMTIEAKQLMRESIDCKINFLDEADDIVRAVQAIIDCLKGEGKVLICGNGGSAADSQHIAGELIGRFKLERKALSAVALTTDSSIITSLGNDYSFDVIFERQVEALGKKGDLLIGISTSGKSKNIVLALKKAKELGMKTISLTGKDGGEIKNISDININAASNNTPRIQECHMLAYHTICELVEKGMIREQKSRESNL